MTHDTPPFDPRLLGTWKSDRRKTFRHNIPPVGFSEVKQRKFRRLFGRLEVRFTRRRVYTKMDETPLESGPYRVLGVDSDSVAMLLYDFLTNEDRIRHITFEGNHYWIWADGRREYFQRIGP